MGDDKITKEQFLDAYDKYPPSKLEIWQHKYFSRETKHEDKWLSEIFTWVWIGMIIFGM